MTSIKYRPEIDGLRAIAVLCVLFFHVDIALFQGGYVGVDVFFVISGFLITNLIKNEFEADSFHFFTFYIRRARRLFPALFTTIALTLVVAYFIAAPGLLIEIAESALSATLSLSNVYFWLKSGYFSLGSHLKPLLHTWSLGVEEQFYLLWPALIIGLFRLKKKSLTPLLILIIAVISLIAAEIFINDHPEAVFFLAPFRVFQFAIGAILVWYIEQPTKDRWINELLLATGLLLILYSATTFDDTTRFPAHNALYPSIGAALVIFYGNTKYLGIVLRNPLMRGIGLISYSMYLIHWPIYVFYRYHTQQPLTLTESVAIISATLIGGYLLYRFVEQPFRKPRNSINTTETNRGDLRLMLSLSVVAVLLVSVSTYMWRTDGLPDRRGFAEHVFADINFTEQQNKRYQIARNLAPPKTEGFTRKGTLSSEKPNALVIGDSHAVDGFNIINRVFGKAHNYLLTGEGRCSPFSPETAAARLNPRTNRSLCLRMIKEAYTREYYEGVDYVFISNLTQAHYFGPAELRYYINFLHSIGQKKIIVAGNHIQLREPMYIAGQGVTSIKQAIEIYIWKFFNLNNELKNLCEEMDCLFLDKKEKLCQTDDYYECQYDVNGIPIVWDNHHMSYEFAVMLGSYFEPELKAYLQPDHP